MNALADKHVKVITGNAAAAHGARLCRPDVVAAYPITPQSEVVEQLAKWHADGSIDCEYVTVEGENSAQNVVCGASMAGSRAYTATSSYGLVYMYDAMLNTAGYRAPVVMVNVNREPPGIHAVCSGQQDMICVRDSGWVQLIAENCQEILDLSIQAFRLAEDHGIQLPVILNYDGYYLSYLAEAVNIPSVAEVDDYLSILKTQPKRPTLIPGQGIGCGSHGIGPGFVEARKKHMDALDRVYQMVDDIDAEFDQAFGRGYGGQLEAYRCEDADIILVTSGSAVGTARTVVNARREAGIKVGLVKIRLFRPWPIQRLARVLKGKKAIGILDRSLCFGWGCGPLHMETKAIIPTIGEFIPMLGFIDGLANMDITKEHIDKMIDDIYSASKGNSYQEVTWLP
ncbi:pyruvate synthase subunit PorA [Desulfobacula sp.]|uniref:pyruvate synthase subunit PorA n=1 Tax=Desulfobacula sp. TaxID=2593537 RepID=UPI00261F476E|nr:pyruvate synthase subunit PorA [Desulfobacula sp.]